MCVVEVCFFKVKLCVKSLMDMLIFFIYVIKMWKFFVEFSVLNDGKFI